MAVGEFIVCLVIVGPFPPSHKLSASLIVSVETHLPGRALRRWLAFQNHVQVPMYLQRHECTLHVIDGAVYERYLSTSF